jgi:hypothetical protein
MKAHVEKQNSKQAKDAKHLSTIRPIYNAALKSVIKSYDPNCSLEQNAEKLKMELLVNGLRFSRKINTEDLKTIKNAIEQSDWEFFYRISKTLKRPAERPSKEPTLAEQFLLENWDAYRELSDRELLVKTDEWLFRHKKHRDSITHDLLKKARQRLNLFKKPNSLVKQIEQVKTLVNNPTFKKVIKEQKKLIKGVKDTF